MKHVANTLTGILKDKTLVKMRDRSITDLSDVIETVTGYWKFDLFSRKPGPAIVEDGILKTTDLDLLTCLMSMSERGAAINLPKYTAIRPKTIKEGEMLVSKENRHGVIKGVVTNQHNFLFSVKIQDANVMTTNSTGKPRDFSITDFDGNWYDGWKRLEFIPTAKENAYLTENDLFTNNSIVFSNFTHPNRWIQFYGQYYFKTKVLIDNLRERSKYYGAILKEMTAKGITFPRTGSTSKSKQFDLESKPKTTTLDVERIQVPAFYVEIDLPMNDTKYPNFKFTSENYKLLHDLKYEYTYHVIPKLQTFAKSVELAHFKHPNRFPGWIKNVEWQKDFTPKGKRTKWDRLILFQPKVGEFGVSIRKRTVMKTEEVSPKYKERNVIKYDTE